MSQAQNVLKEAGKYNVLDTSGNNSNVQTLTAASTLTAGDSGKVFVLNSATEFTTTLPAVATAGSGWHAKFIVGAAPSGADYVVSENTASDTDVIHGGITTSDNTGGAQSSTSGTGASTIEFVDGTALQGDYVDIECDGTNYYIVNSLCQADGGITITT